MVLELKAYTLIQEQGAGWEWHEILEPQSSFPTDTHSSNKATPTPSQTVLSAGDQALRYVSLWGPFSFRLHGLGLGICCWTLSLFSMLIALGSISNITKEEFSMGGYSPIEINTLVNLSTGQIINYRYIEVYFYVSIAFLLICAAWYKFHSYELYMHEHMFIIIQRHIVESQRMKKIPYRQ